ncbi:hypothetical protein Bp8pS_228 [Bacillus phage vB_BpuM-BpSp]|nr:hypothetical protein Bp8pS_228 [Bacillus phage vB_BpuM-BpSp]
MGKSRYYRYSIMSNSGFGQLLFKKGELEFIVPKEMITRDGRINYRLSKILEKKEYEKLESLGIKLINNKK